MKDNLTNKAIYWLKWGYSEEYAQSQMYAAHNGNIKDIAEAVENAKIILSKIPGMKVYKVKLEYIKDNDKDTHRYSEIATSACERLGRKMFLAKHELEVVGAIANKLQSEYSFHVDMRYESFKITVEDIDIDSEGMLCPEVIGGTSISRKPLNEALKIKV